MSLFHDLDTHRQRVILAEWLDFPSDSVWVRRDLMRFDLAMCSTTNQEKLKPLYESLNWVDYFSARGYRRNPAPMIRWVTAKKVAFTKLTLRDFKTDTTALEGFIAANGLTLKEIKLMDTTSAMAHVMKAIATHCTVLETLWLIDCNITQPLATVLNRCNTITELRVQKNTYTARDKNDYHGNLAVRKGVFATVSCPSLRKLAVRNSMDLSEVAAVIAASPNVVELELLSCRGSTALAAMLQTWRHLVVLMIKHCGSPDSINEAVCNALELSAPTLRKLVISGVHSHMNLAAFEHFLSMCSVLTEVSLSWARLLPGYIGAVAVHCNTRLLHLNIKPIDNESVPSVEDVAAIAEHCPNLRTLAVTGLTHCANYVLVLQKCTHIENLYVSFRRHTSAEITAIVRNIAICRNLKRLSIHDAIENDNACEFVDELALVMRNNRKLSIVGVPYQHAEVCHALLNSKKVEVVPDYVCATTIRSEFN